MSDAWFSTGKYMWFQQHIHIDKAESSSSCKSKHNHNNKVDPHKLHHFFVECARFIVWSANKANKMHDNNNNNTFKLTSVANEVAAHLVFYYSIVINYEYGFEQIKQSSSSTMTPSYYY